ncbi:glycosyltransferase family 4 protein [Carboxylicivirga caseinilyticus]|uniref:glycosyltransferase family 4 protein n=1 Tax=Carboxylicivirga caseinilyticus TaxID=3417572 RepID=UPI003D32AA54|nr:glycosyltransferase family 4 protein [Marinilabiliaceae bacterium A049]
MTKQNRLKVGVLFDFQSTWMGGITYIINLVNTLNFLEEARKPEIYFFYTPELKKYLTEINYPYIQYIEKKSTPIIKGFTMSWLKRKNVFIDNFIDTYALDVVYPNRNFPVKNRTKAKVIAWYADLQHKYYPEFFTRQTLIHRAVRLFFMLKNAQHLIVSSEAVKDDFYKFYKIRQKLNFHIYHFVSVNNGNTSKPLDELKAKYNIPDDYFMVSNQFHKHKNHQVVLKALAQLNDQGIKKHIVFTGRFPQAKNSPYIAEIHQLIEEHQLQDSISMLQVIPRMDQLQLMQYSQAVIQPSLFEGWSTVIEDAISLHVPVIAASLNVNKEQLMDKGIYFNPHDVSELVDILKHYPETGKKKVVYGDYNERIKESIDQLIDVFSSH